MHITIKLLKILKIIWSANSQAKALSCGPLPRMAHENKCMRKMIRVRYTDFVSNEALYKIEGLDPKLNKEK